MQEQSKWVSVYVFHELSFEKILIELIKPIIEDLKSKDYLLSYFFIRYWENGPHVRFRVLPKNDICRDKIISTISTTTEAYFKKENQVLLHRVEFSEYIREIKRYGGNSNIENAERQFEESSKVVINLINENYSKWDYSLAISYAIQMHVTFAKCLFKNNQELIIFFKKIYANWLYYSLKLDNTGEVSKDEIIKVNLFFENSYLKQKDKINNLVKILIDDNFSSKWSDEWISESNIISDRFSNIKQDEETLYFVYDSFIHMTNNRLGIHLRDESFVAYIIYKSLKDLNENLSDK